MDLMPYQIHNLSGSNALPVKEFTAGATLAAMDLVALQASDGAVGPVAGDGSAAQAIGWALNCATAGKRVKVLLGEPNIGVVMPCKEGTTPAAAMNGKYFALDGASGAQTVDVATSNAGDLIRVLDVDADDKLVLAQIAPDKYQYGGAEVS